MHTAVTSGQPIAARRGPVDRAVQFGALVAVGGIVQDQSPIVWMSVVWTLAVSELWIAWPRLRDGVGKASWLCAWQGVAVVVGSGLTALTWVVAVASTQAGLALWLGGSLMAFVAGLSLALSDGRRMPLWPALVLAGTGLGWGPATLVMLAWMGGA